MADQRGGIRKPADPNTLVQWHIERRPLRTPPLERIPHANFEISATPGSCPLGLGLVSITVRNAKDKVAARPQDDVCLRRDVSRTHV